MRTLVFFLSVLLLGGSARAAGPGFVPAGPKDKCAVCGMFVARYANWVAEIVFKDGSHAAFDGPKDLFRYLYAMKTYGSKKTEADVAAVYVTDYYGVKPIDAAKAFYVTESDVNGPMGEELVPFANKADAVEFQKDHKGKRVLAFREVRAELSRLKD